MWLQPVFANISIHGVRLFGLKRLNSCIEAIFWSVVMLLSVVLAIFGLVKFAAGLATYPITTNLAIRNTRATFPAVTACNRGVYKKSVVSTIPTFANMIEAFGQISKLTTISQRVKRSPNEKYSYPSVDRSPVNLETFAPEPTGFRISEQQLHMQKRQVVTGCDKCHYLNGLCYSYAGSTTSSEAAALCNGIGGKLPAFRNASEIMTFQSIKTSLGLSNSNNLVDYRRVVKDTWIDSEGGYLPLVFSDSSITYMCLYACYGGPHFHSIACNDATPMFVICQCSLQCPSFYIPPDTLVLSNITFAPYSVVNFACPPGYSMTGSSNITCSAAANGSIKWSDGAPNCSAITCQALNLTNQIVNGTSNLLTATVGFACQSGLELIGPASLTCIANGSQAVWSSDPPICSLAVPIQNYTVQQFMDWPQFNDRVDLISASVQLNDAMEFLLSDLSSSQMSMLGFQQDEFISSCLFNKLPCQIKDIQMIQVPELLNCYTFNHKNQNSFKLSPGSVEDFGLMMTFDIEQNEYVSTEWIPGVQLFIQEQFDPIMFGAMGVTLSPGFVYHISVSKHEESRLSVPVRQCEPSFSTANYNNMFANYTYFTESCLRSYIQQQIVAKCHCGSPKYPLPTGNSTRFCNITQATCLMEFLESKGSNLVSEANNICSPPCHITERLNEFRNNLITLKLHMPTDQVVVFTETLTFGMSDILSAIGGYLGCAMGVSAVSLVELLALIVTLLQRLFNCDKS